MLGKLLLLAILCASLLAPMSGIRAQAPPAQAEQDSKSATVYITKTGKKYHRAGCRYLSQSQIKTTVKEAQANGYTPCKVCRPPQVTDARICFYPRRRRQGETC
jgi:biopolymer transport protein ExbD